LIISKKLTTDAAAAKLDELNKRQALLTDELEKVEAELGDAPTTEQVRRFVETIQTGDPDFPGIQIVDGDGNTYEGGNDVLSFVMMTPAERRHLVESVFSAALPGGKHAGVYVTPDGKGGFTYTLQGVFIHSLSGRVEARNSARYVPSTPCKPGRSRRRNVLARRPYFRRKIRRRRSSHASTA
jgi:hypothetical protein